MAKIIGMKEKEIKEFLSNDVVELSAISFCFPRS